jgi:hypothetical protein
MKLLENLSQLPFGDYVCNAFIMFAMLLLCLNRSTYYFFS